MAIDGEINFSSYTRAELLESLQRIKADQYPKNYALLQEEIKRRDAGGTPASAAEQTPAVPGYRFVFNPDAKEYFKIWIVNLALTVVTLGIYSPWAKVRKLRYFYSNTTLAGSAFGYHGDPVKILKGRLIAAAGAGAYFLAGKISIAASFIVAILVGLATPWLIVKSRMFTMRVTSWRGIRFNFLDDMEEAYITLLGWLVASIVTVGILFPRFQRERYRFIVNHTRYGTAAFTCEPRVSAFYRAAFGVFGLMIALSIAYGIMFAIFAPAFTALAASPADGVVVRTIRGLVLQFSVYLIIAPVMLGYTQARYLNEVISSSKVGRHQLRSSMSATTLIGLYFLNLFLMVATLGLYTPWAQIRLAQYRLGSTELLPNGSLDDLVADNPAAIPTATGEELGSFLDVDFGF